MFLRVSVFLLFSMWSTLWLVSGRPQRGQKSFSGRFEGGHLKYIFRNILGIYGKCQSFYTIHIWVYKIFKKWLNINKTKNALFLCFRELNIPKYPKYTLNTHNVSLKYPLNITLKNPQNTPKVSPIVNSLYFTKFRRILFSSNNADLLFSLYTERHTPHFTRKEL